MNYNYFHLFKEDEQSNAGLLIYKEKFNKWSSELEKNGIVYNKYYNHFSATELTFNRFSASSPALLNHSFENVSLDEFLFTEDCFNGGLIYLNPEYKNTTANSFGYDYSSFYPNILVGEELKIPTKQGKTIKLESLNFENLKYGMYRVIITCENEQFKRIFGFSRQNTYTHFSLEFANKYKNEFGVNIELKTDCEYNAIVYEKEDLVSSKDIFKNWFNKLYALKSKCKDNQLLKRLLSSLWGSLTKCEKYYFNDEQDEALDDDEAGQYVRVNETYYYHEGEIITRYECVKKTKPYKFHYGRIKAFLLSVSRNVVGELIMDNKLLENVVRINTDGIVLNQEYDFSDLPYYPKPEDKTTGLIKWNNVNNYVKELS